MTGPIETRVARIEAMLGIAAEGDLAPIDRIVQDAAITFGVRPADLRGTSRIGLFVAARRAAAWAARHALADTSLRDLARALGREDHVTILAAIRRADAVRATDPVFRERTDRLLAQARERAGR